MRLPARFRCWSYSPIGRRSTARRAFGTAALLGNAFSVAALAAIAGEEEGTAGGWLEEAAGLLDDADGGHRFSHPLVPQALFRPGSVRTI